MVLSYYIYKYPYILFWHLRNFGKKEKRIAFYCADPLDYEMFFPIQKHLPKIEIIAKNVKTKKYLKEKKIKYTGMPSFPNVVIMARHTPYKFPVSKIVKIGFDHGLYQFKRWTSPKNYNGFNVYFVSSDSQVQTAKKLGINSVKAIGYPKLDRAFNGEIDDNYLLNIRNAQGLNPQKPTILFSTTWDVANLSAIEKWIDKIETLSDDYNIIVTVHTWTKQKHKEKLRAYKNVVFIEEMDATPFLMLADIMVGDYSSIIGEFCALDKPIITFKVPESDRTIPEIIKMIANISTQITSFDQLKTEIIKCLENPKELSTNRQNANKIMFKALDGLAGKRAADIINTYI